ncbi:DUF3034 family protein [Pseudomonas chengduensis]|jgi:hypothetical protein|uniref:DUF3034 domain-containing protein n=2 Tax=Pseudomonadaceae TaxID=135621 RepID=A0A1H2L521_9PSED|nr:MULTISPECIES: DUF3034 family protein [Pseudomonas]KJU76759.1 hypothetical protein N619_29545 [Pseudomonas oleovorans]APU29264.1 hypothetical protein UYA_05765 [Pseudomonas alcaliphila JAB1]KQO43743.1 hypothetical protein ASF15_00375 [Pseudomonas sp. Leaf83]MBG0844160.1 DUF3034 family protein [Pseudomonas chengduensis]MBP3061440.1 DUF3034 family protein [Pseudomonas chengduensis]
MRLAYLLGLCLCAELAAAGEGRLLATGGATSLEGAAGGGITPWAVLAGYGERGEWGADVFATRVETGDYRLDVAGVAAAYGNRIELSYARQRFDLGTLARDLRLPDNSLSQDVLGLKLRLAGDLIYDRLPQIALGLQHKRQRDFLVPSLVGAQRREDSEGYLAASRLILGGAFGYNLLLNANLRYSRANELGLLGFGGDRRDRHSWLKEGSVAVLLDRHWAVGIEYREKPDNLSFAGESDWADLFVGYFPNKNLALVLAYARLGEIATLDNQDGVYLSVQGSF